MLAAAVETLALPLMGALCVSIADSARLDSAARNGDIGVDAVRCSAWLVVRGELPRRAETGGDEEGENAAARPDPKVVDPDAEPDGDNTRLAEPFAWL